MDRFPFPFSFSGERFIHDWSWFQNQSMGSGIVAYILLIIYAIIFVDYFLLSSLSRHILKLSDDNFIWIRREVRLLEALLIDHQSAVLTVDQLRIRAMQFSDPELNLEGISLLLDETQTRWLQTAGDVVNNAKQKVEYYKEFVLRGDFLKRTMSGFAFIKFVSTFQLAREMKKAKREIVDHLELLRQSLHKIVEALEKSKSILRSLQEEPIDQRAHPCITLRPNFRSGAALVTILRCLVHQKAHLVRGMSKQVQSVDIQLMMLYAFMKDLRGLRLEREIENSWAEEAQLIIIETEYVVNTFFARTARPVKYWIPVLSDWIVRRKLKKMIKHIFRRVTDLLEDNEKYGFTLIKKESPRFSHPCPPRQEERHYTVIAIRIESIHASINQAQEKCERVRECVDELCNQLSQTDELLRDTRDTEGARNTRKACLKLLERLASDAVDSTDMYANRRHLRIFLPFLSRSRLLRELCQIMQAVNLLKRSIQVYSTEIVEDSAVVGLEQDIHVLVPKLIGRDAKDSIFSIVGMKGIGKTTLAKMIFNHISVVNGFTVRRWFSLPQESNQLQEALNNCNAQRGREERNYLVVLDNLTSESWDAVQQALEFVRNNRRIKIVITTRYKELASVACPNGIHPLRLRTKPESWELFTQIVPMPQKREVTAEEKQRQKKLLALAKKVVGRTGGLPLAVLYLGYLFSVKIVNHDNLSRVLERFKQGPNQSLWSEAWNLNKTDLQANPRSNLAACLSYFESFPIDFEIPARRLLAVLVARELLTEDTCESSSASLEKAAYNCLKDLISRNMIQVVDRKLNGDVKRCQFPSALRELWQQRESGSWPIRSWYLIGTSLEGQLTYHFDDSDATFSHRIPGLRLSSPNFLQEERYPRSLMFFDTREGRRPGQDIRNFLYYGIKNGRFRNLLVLDLEGVFRPQLPKNIGKLKQLVYLGLRWTYLEKIPASIGKLLNLQTLDVKYTHIRTLPISVWTLKKLRHLYLNEHCRIKFMPKPTAISLKDLQTLLGVFLDKDSPLKDGLNKLNNLLKLGLSFQLNKEDQGALQKSILQLSGLQSLSLSSVGERNVPEELHFTSLKGLKNLSSLYLYGKLQEPQAITSQLPISLTELILSASQLQDDPIANLKTLQQLKSLSFFSGSYVGNAMVFPSGNFPQLLVLKLWSLDNLEKLDVEEGGMPSLREMEIRSCKSLRVTNGLTHLQTLQELKLTNMSEDYETSVRTQFAEAIENSRVRLIHCPRIKIDKISDEILVE